MSRVPLGGIAANRPFEFARGHHQQTVNLVRPCTVKKAFRASFHVEPVSERFHRIESFAQLKRDGGTPSYTGFVVVELCDAAQVQNNELFE